MKKNILTVSLFAVLASSMANADTLQGQVVEQAQTPAVMAVPEMPVIDVKDEVAKEEVSIQEIIASKMKDPAVELNTILKEALDSDTQRNLDRTAKLQSYLQEQRAINEIVEEKNRFNKAIRSENEAVLKELEKVKIAEDKKEEEIKAEEVKELEKQVQEQQQELITDQVVVYSVYGSQSNPFAELSVNGIKYQVQAGHKSEGFNVKSVDSYGVLLEKNGVEQYVNVSKNAVLISTQAVVEEVAKPIPNVIKPYELK